MSVCVNLALVFVASLAPCMCIKLPEQVKMGVGTSAYQVEGGWDVDGKGENIWDHFTHTRTTQTADHSSADIACDSYHLWQEDVKMLKDLNVDFYRFSLSWSRLLPTGFTNELNPQGVRYYNNLIDELLKNKIEPFVTIFHWDLPKPLHDLGGWTNAKTAEYFEDYAKVAFELFGDRVKWWATFNEPGVLCIYGYDTGRFAPGVSSPGVGNYLCGKTVLLAHARAYRLYERLYKRDQGGNVGIVVDITWYEPKSNSTKDIQAAKRMVEFNFGWMVDPIFSEKGNFPETMIKRVSYLSRHQNFSESRLPYLKKSEISFIKGTSDFMGINYYTSRVAKDDCAAPFNPPSFQKDTGAIAEKFPNAEATATDWFQVVPWGFKRALDYIREKYKNPPVIVAENGYSDVGQFNDARRIRYLQEHLTQIVDAIDEGSQVLGYTYWSFIDTWEWSDGFTVRFGLIGVDFDSPNKTRIPKASAEYYKELVKYRII